jgi:glucose-6-phosphate-specific signal transduction histidine kinase
MLLTEGFPLIMSLRDSVIMAITQIRDTSSDSQQLPINEIKQNLLEEMDLTDSDITEKRNMRNEVSMKSEYQCEVSKIKNSDEL